MTTYWVKAPPLPPSPRRRRDVGWWVVAVLIGLTGLAVAGVLALSLIGLYVYANHDRIELIDRPDVEAVVDAGCGRLRTALAASPVDGGNPAERRGAAITAQDQAIRDFVTRVRRDLDAETRADDLPLDDWLADWERLATSRDDVADGLRRGTKVTFVVPRDHGEPITQRMASVGLDCIDLRALVRHT